MSANTRLDVLIVNCNDAISRMMATMIRSAGYRVIVSGSFYEARRILSSDLPRLLIADIRLEQFNGLHLAWHRAVTCPGPSIITDVVHDAVLKTEAEKIRASYFLLPADQVAVVMKAMAVLGAPSAMIAKRTWAPVKQRRASASALGMR